MFRQCTNSSIDRRPPNTRIGALERMKRRSPTFLKLHVYNATRCATIQPHAPHPRLPTWPLARSSRLPAPRTEPLYEQAGSSLSPAGFEPRQWVQAGDYCRGGFRRSHLAQIVVPGWLQAKRTSTDTVVLQTKLGPSSDGAALDPFTPPMTRRPACAWL